MITCVASGSSAAAGPLIGGAMLGISGAGWDVYGGGTLGRPGGEEAEGFVEDGEGAGGFASFMTARASVAGGASVAPTPCAGSWIQPYGGPLS
jgi:hypothetical protein